VRGAFVLRGFRRSSLDRSFARGTHLELESNQPQRPSRRWRLQRFETRAAAPLAERIVETTLEKRAGQTGAGRFGLASALPLPSLTLLEWILLELDALYTIPGSGVGTPPLRKGELLTRRPCSSPGNPKFPSTQRGSE